MIEDLAREMIAESSLCTQERHDDVALILLNNPKISRPSPRQLEQAIA
jgi:hypothetical protein